MNDNIYMFHVGQMTYTFYVQYIMEDPFSLLTSTYFLHCAYVCDYNLHAHIYTAWYEFEHTSKHIGW